MLLRDHNGDKAYKLLFLCKPYHQLSVIKDFVSFSFVFIVDYMFLKQFVKLLMVKYTYLLFKIILQEHAAVVLFQTQKIQKQKFVMALEKEHSSSDMQTIKRNSITSNTKLIQNCQTNVGILYQEPKLRTCPGQFIEPKF